MKSEELILAPLPFGQEKRRYSETETSLHISNKFINLSSEVNLDTTDTMKHANSHNQNPVNGVSNETNKRNIIPFLYRIQRYRLARNCPRN